MTLLLVVPLIGAAVGFWGAALGWRVRDRFHVQQTWFILGAFAALLLAMAVHATRPFIGASGGYVLALALVGAAIGSIVSATER